MSTSSEQFRSSNSDGATSTEFDPAQLIEDHQVGVWRYLRALGCDAGEADDLTQETFLAVLSRPFQYMSKAATAAYLRKVAYHRFISVRRRQGKEINVADMEYVEESWSRWVGAHDSGNELLDALRACFQQLTRRAQWALEMRFRDKLARTEIAKALAITDHGAKNLMQRAKAKLRGCIESKLS